MNDPQNAGDNVSSTSSNTASDRPTTIDEDNVITALRMFSEVATGESSGCSAASVLPSSIIVPSPSDEYSSTSIANVTVERETVVTDSSRRQVITARSEDSTEFKEYLIDDNIWITRLQDNGKDENQMKTDKTPKSYSRMQVPKYGANNMYYIGLSSIAIDYIISFKNDADYWSRLPKNPTNVKMKLIELLLKCRTLRDNNKYALDQKQFLHLLNNQWGGKRPASVIEDNDRLRLFGLLLTREVCCVSNIFISYCMTLSF